MNKAVTIIMASVLALLAPCAHGWDTVYDPTNTAQNAKTTAQLADSYAKQLQQYTLQLQQYQKQLQNMLNPETWGFGSLTSTINSIKSLRDSMMDSFEQFKGLANYEDLLNQLMNMRDIADSSDGEGGSCGGSGSGCGGGGGGCQGIGTEPTLKNCEGELQQLQKNIEDADKQVMKLIDENFEWLKDFQQQLKDITDKAKTAQGEVQAIQYQSELISLLIQLQVRVMQFDQTTNANERLKAAAAIKQNKIINREHVKTLKKMLEPGELFNAQSQSSYVDPVISH